MCVAMFVWEPILLVTSRDVDTLKKMEGPTLIGPYTFAENFGAYLLM